MWKKSTIARLYILITLCIVSVFFLTVWFWNVHAHYAFLKHPSSRIDSVMYLLTISSLQSLALSIYTYFAIESQNEIYMLFYLSLTFESCVLQLVAGYLSFQGERFWSDISIEARLRYAIYRYGIGKIDPQNNLNITHVQTELGCCGIWNYTDWRNTHWWHLRSHQQSDMNDYELLPKSCCTREALSTSEWARWCNRGKNQDFRALNLTNINTNGCLLVARKWLRNYLEAAGSLTLVITMVEMALIYFATTLCWDDIRSMVIEKGRMCSARCNLDILDDDHEESETNHSKESESESSESD